MNNSEMLSEPLNLYVFLGLKPFPRTARKGTPSKTPALFLKKNVIITHFSPRLFWVKTHLKLSEINIRKSHQARSYSFQPIGYFG
jgi:hypothetical protein